MRFLKPGQLLALCTGLFCGLFVSTAQAGILPGPLVDVAWLHDHAKDVQIVDIRDDINSLTADPIYKTEGGKKVLVSVGGYIPDALSVNFWAIRSKRAVAGKTIDFLLPSQADFQAVMQASVLNKGKPLVLVPTGDDASSLQEAAYLAYELQVFGMPAADVAILNGGTHAWMAAGYQVDNDAIAPMNSGNWTAVAENPKLVATTAQVLQASKQGRPMLLDARPLAQYVGVEASVVATQPGRIARAHALPPSALYRTAADGSARFLSPAQYRAVLPLLGVPVKGAKIVYCNTGQFAASAWFIFDRLLGQSDVRVYPGSINEWSHLGEPMVGLPANAS